MDELFKVFKLFFPDGGYGFAFVHFNQGEDDITINKSRCVTIGNRTCFIPYAAIPGQCLNDGARYIKPKDKFGLLAYKDIHKTRPHDDAIMSFFWKQIKAPIIEYVGEIRSSELALLR